jgi:hypothetical protein
MWQAGEWKDFCEMLPEYAAKGHGEGFMHDTAMMLGVLGWSEYTGQAEVVTPYFGASGTGQINALFPVTARHRFGHPAARGLARRRLHLGRHAPLNRKPPCPTSSSSTPPTSTSPPRRAASTWAACAARCADAMLAVRDEQDRQVFPTGGTRVLAYPAAHSAVSDGGAAGRRPGWAATTPSST